MRIHSAKELALVVIGQRRRLKLSQTEVGQLVGLNQKTISAFENKPDSTELETLFRILSAVNFDMMIFDKNKMSAEEALWKEEW